MGHELRLFFSAWVALTRGPLAGADAEHARHFPAVGLVVGGLAAVVLWAAAHLWPAPVAVGVALVAPVWLTRARHEEALLHGVQALTGRPAAATVALVAVLGLKAAALHGLAVRDFAAALAVLPLAHALSRAALVLAQPQAARGVGPAAVLAWCLIAAALALALGLQPVAVMAALLAAALAGAVVAREPAMHGALQAVVETAVLLAVLAAVVRT